MQNAKNLHSIFSLFIIITTVQAAKTYLGKPTDGFYHYVLNKGIPITQISDTVYRVSHLKWTCDIDTSIARKFTKNNISWKDMFETRKEILSNKTIFSSNVLQKKMGVLPKDGLSVILVARQGNMSIPKENVIIRLNNHGPLDANTTMVMTWSSHVKTITRCAREQPHNETISWTHYKPDYNRNYGLWNTSQPLVVPEQVWSLKDLKYYRGSLFFMKGDYSFGHLAKCNPKDGIGLGALNRVYHLNGEVSTLGFSTGRDKYNMAFRNRFYLLAHKLAWSYYVVKELTDESDYAEQILNTTPHIYKVTSYSDKFLNLEIIFIYLTVITVMCIISCSVKYRQMIIK